jgi:hypothetical protein
MGLMIEIAVVRPSGHIADISGEYDVSITRKVVTVNRDARSLARVARRLQEREEGVPSSYNI